ncbi:MAG: c-type cytochrome, partial [Myxococcota bacterium]
DGRIYHVVTDGQNIMPSYAVQILPRDRWAAVRYVRDLQSRLPVAPPAANAAPESGATPATSAAPADSAAPPTSAAAPGSAAPPTSAAAPGSAAPADVAPAASGAPPAASGSPAAEGEVK